jgi:alkaline phosphatase D
MRYCLLLLVFTFNGLYAQSLFDKEIEPLFDAALKPFYFGVASGDPQQDQVVIWTKVWQTNGQPVQVKWQVATDTTMQHIVAQGDVTTTEKSAYTVKVLAYGLQPGTYYYYRFSTGGVYSPVGRTKTAPVTTTALKFAVVSCNHFEGGYFNAYRLIANRNDIDAVIHLGDYIYEYGARKPYKNKVIRSHIPAHEILTLQDYRTRYAQYRLDKDLQEAHRLHPFITEWDDHEFANNTYKDGAGNHQAEEGDWEQRKATARKVYFEWLPIADNDKESVIRKIGYGNMADLFMLDGRVEARCKQLNGPDDTLLTCETRTMLGKEQSDWLTTGIRNSTAHWKIMANQVIFSEVDAHRLSKKYAINPDAWDGYPVERNAILDTLYKYNQQNVIIITGDIHSSWGFDLTEHPKDKQRYNRKTGKGVIGAEFVAPSISTNGLAERIPAPFAKLVGSLIKNRKATPHLKYIDLVYHGYLLLGLDNEKTQATWVYCKTIRKHSQAYKANKSYITKYNANRLVKVKSK